MSTSKTVLVTLGVSLVSSQTCRPIDGYLGLAGNFDAPASAGRTYIVCVYTCMCEYVRTEYSFAVAGIKFVPENLELMWAAVPAARKFEVLGNLERIQAGYP